MTKPSKRQLGCFTFGVSWVGLFFLVFALANMGDCIDAQCEARREQINIGIAVVALIGLLIGGWFYYRAEMKDSGF